MNIEQWANNHETSYELAVVIFNMGDDPERIWQDPERHEVFEIAAQLFKQPDFNPCGHWWGEQTFYDVLMDAVQDEFK